MVVTAATTATTATTAATAATWPANISTSQTLQLFLTVNERIHLADDFFQRVLRLVTRVLPAGQCLCRIV